MGGTVRLKSNGAVARIRRRGGERREKGEREKGVRKGRANEGPSREKIGRKGMARQEVKRHPTVVVIWTPTRRGRAIRLRLRAFQYHRTQEGVHLLKKAVTW